ncbi:MAG: hypothetical protein Q8J78_11185 [Moraxellaceae bacterium]|nr:hypothetical protein [Moraxellaceae bacterium]
MKIRLQALRGHPEAPLMVLDLVMLVLISINLLWLLVDAVLLNTGIGVLLTRHDPEFISRYRAEWHGNLLVADSIFTLFLISELLLRWAVAIWRRTHYRWWFYPFVHWYDVLGCIPLPPFRALRLLRLISIVYRLQKMGVIDLSQTGTFTVFMKYYRMVLEQLSDRIVINVIDGVKDEVKAGGPLSQRLTDEVLVPRREVIVPWLAALISQAAAQAHAEHRENLPVYLRERTRMALAANPEFQKIRRRIPLLGQALEDELQTIVGSLLVQISTDLLNDIGKPGNIAAHDVAAGLFDTLTAGHHDMGEAVRGIVLDSLELVKAQVEVQQWKLAAESTPRE